MLNKLSEGINQTKQITITLEDEEYPFQIRPLTDGELSKLKKIENNAFSLKFKIDDKGNRKGQPVKEDNEAVVKGGEFTESHDQVKYTAIAWSLSIDGDEVTVEDVQTLPPGLPDLLFEEIIKVSSLSNSDLTAIKKFRKNK